MSIGVAACRGRSESNAIGADPSALPSASTKASVLGDATVDAASSKAWCFDYSLVPPPPIRITRSAAAGLAMESRYAKGLMAKALSAEIPEDCPSETCSGEDCWYWVRLLDMGPSPKSFVLGWVQVHAINGSVRHDANPPITLGVTEPAPYDVGVP